MNISEDLRSAGRLGVPLVEAVWVESTGIERWTVSLLSFMEIASLNKIITCRKGRRVAFAGVVQVAKFET